MNKQLLFFIFCFILAIAIGVLISTTYDSGDSFYHYLFARYSVAHPHLLLDHWAKPLFTLLAAPFAYWGYMGMKVFNCMVGVAGAYFTYLSAKKLGLKNPLLASFFLFFMPQYFLSMYSGLTEPLFALVLVASLYLMLDDKKAIALVLISFLPFVRSEGNVIIIVYAVYLLFKREYKLLPWLATGTIVYSIVGFFYFESIFWVFTNNPYTQGSDNYGRGLLLHYVRVIGFMIGFPLLVLFIIGGASRTWKGWKDKEWKINKLFTVDFFLLYGCFAAYFVSHSIFWWQGWFHSFGMPRVLIAIMPLIALICLQGLNAISEITLLQSEQAKKWLIYAIILLVIIFPFLGNKAGWKIPRDFQLTKDQQLIKKVGEWYKQSPYQDSKVFYSSQYFAEALGVDPFDTLQKGSLHDVRVGRVPANSLVFWDEWFSVTEENTPLSFLKENPEYELLRQDTLRDRNTLIEINTFRKK